MLSRVAVAPVQVRKIKRGACEYDYVEVMACPGGCLNGGGQSAAAPGQSPSQLLDRLDAVYHDPEVPDLASALLTPIFLHVGVAGLAPALRLVLAWHATKAAGMPI